MSYFYMYIVYVFPAVLIYFSTYVNYLSNSLCEYSCAGYDASNFEYDYIVVGAGSAGSIVARRLAEYSDATVLLIEAGGNSSSLFDVPLISPLLQLTHQDWHYKTTVQEHACYALDDNISIWPRGKVVGGSSCLNYMLYVRGHKEDYNLWYKGTNEEWNFVDLLPYFKRTEKQIGRFKSSPYHSVYGEFPVSDLQYKTPLADAFLKAGKELKFSVNDLNEINQTGFMEPQVNVFDGKHQNVARRFLGPYRRNNFKILTNSVVKKVLFYSKYEARGVVVVRFKQEFKIKARKAVILSAGTIGTPEILLRSGIGPKEHLNSLE